MALKSGAYLKKNKQLDAILPETDALEIFHPAVREWFEAVFPAPTRPQTMGWPSIARGESTLILA
ncbi:MAG: ATP-dependent helicase Lhr and Lhr-like helicase, partial [Acidobacteriaceae bacterium]